MACFFFPQTAHFEEELKGKQKILFIDQAILNYTLPYLLLGSFKMFFNLFSHFKLKSGGGELMSLKALA
jgi:hypothetical protein